jgi:hypothetical protein
MYTKQEYARARKNFWSSFGQYMKPVAGAAGLPVNWLNYKTGIKDVFFRMDADDSSVSIGIELRHADPEMQKKYFEQLLQLKLALEGIAKETWEWKFQVKDEDGNLISRIDTSLNGVNIFLRQDWPAMISFLKPRIITLDEFWELVKEKIV